MDFVKDERFSEEILFWRVFLPEIYPAAGAVGSAAVYYWVLCLGSYLQRNETSCVPLNI